MKNITTADLKAMLEAQKGATAITITALVDARARKTNNPYEQVLKLSMVNGFTGFEYETSVQRQQVREGNPPEFEASERKWGTAVNKSLVENKGKYYLVIRPLKTSQPKFFVRVGNLVKRIEKSLIEHLLPAPYSNKEHQGVEKEIIYRNYSLDSIRFISINGSKYRLIA